MQKFLIVHYSIKNKERWGRTFPIAKALAKKGFEVTLLTTANKRDHCILQNIEMINGVKIISFNDILPNRLLGKGVGLISFFSRIIYSLTHRFNFVYSDCGETPNGGWPCKINQWVFRSAYISEWGDLIGRGGYYDSKPRWFKLLFGKYYLWADLYFRRTADVVIVLADYMKEYAKSRGILIENIVVIPGGADCDVLPEINVNKSEINLDEKTITLGYIGINDGEAKDLLPLIRVLQENRYKEKFKIITYGKYLSSDFIISNNLENILIECGWVNYYEDYHKLQYVDIYLLIKTELTLSSAGWPNKLGDYMSIGRPVLLNLYGDISKFVTEFPDGFIQISLARESIASQLDNILSNKYDLNVMGHKNRLIAEEIISWDSRVDQLIRFLYQ